MVRDRINDIRTLINGKRLFFIENLESDLFIQGFPGLHPFTRNKLRAYFKSDGDCHVNSYLLDAMLKVDNFPEKFIKFCDENECCTDLRNLILKEVNRTLPSGLNLTSVQRGLRTNLFNTRNISTESCRTNIVSYTGENIQTTIPNDNEKEDYSKEKACEMNLEGACNILKEQVAPCPCDALVLQENGHNKLNEEVPCTLMAGLNNNSQCASKPSINVNRTSLRQNSTSAQTCPFNSRNISSETSNGEHTQASMANHKHSEQENNLNQNEIACEMNLDSARNMQEELIVPSSNEALVFQEKDHFKQNEEAPCTLMAGLNNNSHVAYKPLMHDKELSDLTSAGSQGSDDSYYLSDSNSTDCVEPNHEIDSLKETAPKTISECDDDTQYMSTLNVSENGNNSKINTAIAAGKLTNDVDSVSSGIQGEDLEKEKQSMAVLNFSNSSAEDGSNNNCSLSVMAEKLEPCSQTEVKQLFDGHCEVKECLDDFSTFTYSILIDFPIIHEDTCEDPQISLNSDPGFSGTADVS